VDVEGGAAPANVFDVWTGERPRQEGHAEQTPVRVGAYVAKCVQMDGEETDGRVRQEDSVHLPQDPSWVVQVFVDIVEKRACERPGSEGEIAPVAPNNLVAPVAGPRWTESFRPNVHNRDGVLAGFTTEQDAPSPLPRSRSRPDPPIAVASAST
jgi:hypothetical protein